MRFNLKPITLAGLLVCLSASALATNYYFVQPKPGEMSKAYPLNVSLNPSTLPYAVVGTAYNNGAGFDLKSVLSVTGDSSFNASMASFSVTAGTLPAGLTVSASGLITGTPTVASAGSNVQVTATYKTASGIQTYQVISLNITVTLAAATLPQATVGTLYNVSGYDFKPQLSVTGDATFTPSQANFTLTQGSVLPGGLALSAEGMLTGTPTGTTAGANFTVNAAYKLKNGQQAYTLIINGVGLQITSIATGFNHTCAVTTTGAAKCWGVNGSGQLGDGTVTAQSTPVTVDGLSSGVAQISAGRMFTCAVLTTGAVKCWGINTNGQLGDNTTITQKTPVDVAGLAADVKGLSLATTTACALTTAGGVKCWGGNGSGQLGDGTILDKLTPVDVAGLPSGVAKISAGSSSICAITTAGAAKCWGSNNNGQLGDGTLVAKLTPTDVVGLSSGVTAISAGPAHACAVTSGGTKCWGYNNNGQLGDGTIIDRLTPTAIAGLESGVSSISAGNANTCAISSNGAKCWGLNSSGQLGDGTFISKSLPVSVIGLETGAINIVTASGSSHVCAMTVAGAKCWGNNTGGRLGDGTAVTRNAPVSVLP